MKSLRAHRGVCLRALIAFALSASALMIRPASAGPQLTGQEARAFLGGRTGKIVYLKSLVKQVYYLDFSDSVLKEKRVSDDSYCWSPMIHPDGSRIVYESQANIYIRFLEENSTQRFLIYSGTPMNGLSLEPHWWIHPKTGDEYIIYCTGNIADLEWPPKSGQTFIQKINKQTNLPDGPPLTLLPFMMASGRSKSGLWGATSHHSTGMYKFYPDKVDNAFFAAKNWQDSGGWGACNGSISPSKDPARQNRMMHLNSYLALPGGETFDNHKGIVMRSWDDADLDHPLWVMGIPGVRCNNDSSGNLFWDHSEWSTDEEYFTAIGSKVVENFDSSDIYMGRINYVGENQIRRVLKGNINQYPHLWIKDGVLPAKIHLEKTAIDFVSLKKDSAGPPSQTVGAANSGDGILPPLEIGKLPAWLKVAITGNGGNTPKIVNTIDRAAVAPGDYSAVVKVTFGQLADSASYTVRFKYTDPVLTSLRIDPAAAALLPGQTVRLRALALDQVGQPLSPQPGIVWTALDSLPITGQGEVTADSAVWKDYAFKAAAGTVACTSHVFISKRILRIDAGASPDSVAAGWVADGKFTSGGNREALASARVDMGGARDSALETMYRSVRYPAAPYLFDSLPNGRYAVRLHFASAFPGHAVSTAGAGVKFEGQHLIDNYLPPVSPDSGIKGESRDVQVTVSDGDGLKVEFEGGSFALAGLEVHDIGVLPIELESPTAGDVYYVGDTMHVRWTGDGFITSAGIQFSQDSGQTWIPVTRRSSVNLGQPAWGDYPWAIPDSLDGHSLVSEKCMISVYDYFGTDRDRSDKTFSVRANPQTSLRAPAHPGSEMRPEFAPGRIVFGLTQPGRYRASLTDMRGRESASGLEQGPGSLSLSTAGLRRGVYRLRLEGPGVSMARLVTVLE
ncbi:MAG: hypothetical protein JWO30_1299 [Fibrobacteres bacterium]|nr:hypothetical protein [Fibrobacterota bacterium]